MNVKNGFGLSKNIKLLRQQLVENQFKNGYELYTKIKKANKDFTLSEDEINFWDYQLLE